MRVTTAALATEPRACTAPLPSFPTPNTHRATPLAHHSTSPGLVRAVANLRNIYAVEDVGNPVEVRGSLHLDYARGLDLMVDVLDVALDCLARLGDETAWLRCVCAHRLPLKDPLENPWFPVRDVAAHVCEFAAPDCRVCLPCQRHHVRCARGILQRILFQSTLFVGVKLAEQLQVIGREPALGHEKFLVGMLRNRYIVS